MNRADRAQAQAEAARSYVRGVIAAIDAREPVYPQRWTVEVTRNPAGRAWYFVSRFVSRGQVEFVLEGFSDEPWKTRIRHDAQECADTLNKKAAA